MEYYLFCTALIFWFTTTVIGQKLIFFNKPIEASSVLDPWYTSQAVDGNTDRGKTCTCCAAAVNNNPAWFRLDLEQTYTVHSIFVLGRLIYLCDGNKYGQECVNTCGKCLYSPCDTVDGTCTACATGYKLPMCKECDITYHGLECNQRCFCANGDCNKESGICSIPICSAGYLGDKCDTPCDDKDYGQNCNESCGKCFGADVCYKDNGICPNGCEAGYKGNTCKDECLNGTYGQNCQEICGSCFNNETCDKADGRCAQCAAGYMGDTCDEQCENGKYGLGCEGDCGKCFNGMTCNPVNGSCNTCSAGYTGDKCVDYCESGNYGDNCSLACDSCSGDTCDFVTGICQDGCEEGFNGTFCEEACPNGTFGKNCITQCGFCLDEATCQPDFGKCERGCAQGYDPPTCIYALSDETTNIPVGPIVGAAAGTVVVAIVIIVVVTILKRRHMETDSSSSNQFFQEIHDNDVTENPQVNTPTKPSVQVNRENNDSLVKKQEHTSVKDQPFELNEPKTENVYYAFLSQKNDLKICQLWDYIRFKKREDCAMLYTEYGKFSKKPKHPYDVAMKPQNRGKNRYKAIFAYDHSRVPLVSEDNTEGEYINASFIDGFDKPRKFIASQGPIESMRDDFWRMVWQQKSKNIVILTNLIENGANKCILYWPTLDEKTVTYGKITITLLSENSTVDYVIRHMEINKGGEDSKLPVTQFHYKAWPDKSYPDSTWSLVKFWLKVEENTSKVTDSGPFVVHCSAGIGRTGTYIAFDNAFYQAKKTGTVWILDVVKSLREQRIGMVQTQDQYVYLHEAVADALLFGTHFIWSTQFEDVYEYLSQKEDGSYITRLQTQFHILVESIADKRFVHTALEDGDNEYSNIIIHRELAHVSIDEYRPKSKSLGFVKEVGALVLQNHEAKDAFIICKSPTESRMADFWYLVKEQNVKTIVSLADKSSFLGIKNKAVQDKCGVSLSKERKTSIFTERTINLKDSTDDITISQFEYTNWASGDNAPKDPCSMVQFIEAVLDRQRRLSEADPVLIYCNNGTQRCGMMCALLSEVYRVIKDGGHINIIETVKMMKERHDDIIANFDQYAFIHDVIRSRVQDHTYQN